MAITRPALAERLAVDGIGIAPVECATFALTRRAVALEIVEGETQVELNLAGGSTGGLILFYNEKAFAGITSNGKDVTIYDNAEIRTNKSVELGKHFYLKIKNNRNICDMFASKDGKNWIMLRTGLDISGLNHNKYRGFFALRPGFMSAGKEGSVVLDNFKYKSIK